MSHKQTILATGFVLWVLGVLVGTSAGNLLPGDFSITSEVMLIVALVASLANFVVLYRKVQ
jgi:Co/Zn/Cd efflux system component